MKFFLLAVGTWLSGLLMFLGGSVAFNDGLGRFAGLITLFSVAVAAATIVVLYFPTMLVLRARMAWRNVGPYTAAGGCVGFIPGVAVGLFAAAVGNIDGSPKTIVELLTSSSGLLGLGAGLTSGMVFGAGFFAGFVRQSA
jgi:hypothetical protein